MEGADRSGESTNGSRGFADRRDAGRRLGELLQRHGIDHTVVVAAIPRGGIPVAAEVADLLGAPLDVVNVRKVGAPQNPEFAIGAVAEGGVRVLSERVAHALARSAPSALRAVATAEAELDRRAGELRAAIDPIDLGGRTVIVVDDGLATGRTARAAIRAVQRRGAARVVLAVPVAAPSSVRALAREADDVVCVEEPDDLRGVGFWYEDFRPPSRAEVRRLLAN